VEELKELDARRPGSQADTLKSVRTPLHPEEWETSLRPHPDKWYTSYLVKGMKEGFRIGFRYGQYAI